ncbi:hypothetical protein CRG98_027053 [Punica granatum]|uniref:BHLH domain-containing protein n=1 Tax=Punica granatum TaxID=22663 RepID=A0A2I0J8A9_PUNGR|nr:hypothetical protein CRG98_027053 [Punica granatum]
MGIIDFQESLISWTTNENVKLPREENNFEGGDGFINFPDQQNSQSLENGEIEDLSSCPKPTDHTTPLMQQTGLAYDYDSNVNLGDIAEDEKLRLEKKRNHQDDPIISVHENQKKKKKKKLNDDLYFLQSDVPKINKFWQVDEEASLTGFAADYIRELEGIIDFLEKEEEEEQEVLSPDLLNMVMADLATALEG